jgi:hypothetical protein
VVLERGSLSLVSTIEELTERNSSDSSLENRDYGRRVSATLTMRHPLSVNVDTNFAEKRRSLGRYRSLVYKSHGVSYPPWIRYHLSLFLFSQCHIVRTLITLPELFCISLLHSPSNSSPKYQSLISFLCFRPLTRMCASRHSHRYHFRYVESWCVLTVSTREK